MTGRNRLASATSPYLLQHAKNPVHWWPWSDEAFAVAERQVPVFLSVGYAACHWCHVMAHESFEDELTASMINEHFVAIKVDREERPDVDAVYMQATQALTGQGGWPMSVFLTPDRKPFYAGTYFPPTPRHGLPSFSQVLRAISEAWRDRRSELLGSATEIVRQLSKQPTLIGSEQLTAASVRESILLLQGEFDPTYGGFGRAPKFPPSMVLEALLREGGEAAMLMVGRTLEAMAHGGIYDQLVAASRATASTRRGWCPLREDARQCAAARTRTGGAVPASRSLNGSSLRPWPGCCARCGPSRARSRRVSTLTRKMIMVSSARCLLRVEP